MSAQSWQIACPRCGWANSGSQTRCMKCGQPLRTAPGLLVAGQSASAAIAPKAPPRRITQPGGFFPRLIALIIDILILSVFSTLVWVVWTSQLVPTSISSVNGSNVVGDQLRGFGVPLGGITNDQLNQLGALYLGLFILQLFYYVGSWSILGASPGQLVMGLRIIDRSAKSISFGRALGRYFWKVIVGGLCVVPTVLSVVMVAVGKDKRAFHDLMSGTYVIQFLDPESVKDAAAPLPPVQAQPPMPAQPAAQPPPPPPVPQPSAAPDAAAGVALAAAAVASPPPPVPEAYSPPQGQTPMAAPAATPAPFPPAADPLAGYAPPPVTMPEEPPPPAAPAPQVDPAPVAAPEPLAYPPAAAPEPPDAPEPPAALELPAAPEPPAAPPPLPAFPDMAPPMAPMAPPPPHAPQPPTTSRPAGIPDEPYAMPFAPMPPVAPLPPVAPPPPPPAPEPPPVAED